MHDDDYYRLEHEQYVNDNVFPNLDLEKEHELIDATIDHIRRSSDHEMAEDRLQYLMEVVHLPPAHAGKTIDLPVEHEHAHYQSEDSISKPMTEGLHPVVPVRKSQRQAEATIPQGEAISAHAEFMAPDEVKRYGRFWISHAAPIKQSSGKESQRQKDKPVEAKSKDDKLTLNVPKDA
mmetsp:Transcript_7421/g.8977  ORF Transcript_7421/g.8977 Transcript_7421/m.8977 type:complete len:178 (+) Transcript_7421:2602-3135(+)|eukprot:CAMPEP_0170454134 /NCGR_PEP_ID=MMETSP0123-20130129/2488_1 /TAXON_ID=182087 /ORGANISM="Favella ehrenbergii, Strain Fehren 1" /LENGTH=177 /DNA_ID=CAMNT_0010716747 /DNA_START=2538 /DNA_END=3071 /DNA_ORIENTATION=-